MKKHTFYSLIRDEKGKRAVLQQGYTDGEYHYYKKENSVWFAIYPLNGLALCSGATRKACVEKVRASRLQEKLNRAITTEIAKLYRDEFLQLVEKAINQEEIKQ